MQNNILTLRDAKKEFTQIKKYFDLKESGDIKDPFKIKTKCGLYLFHFDENENSFFQNVNLGNNKA